jgi:hypothetical protein
MDKATHSTGCPLAEYISLQLYCNLLSFTLHEAIVHLFFGASKYLTHSIPTCRSSSSPKA